MTAFQLVPIVYYCHKRKALFKRNVLVDQGYEHKLAGLRFMTMTNADGRISVAIQTSCGFRAALRGISASVPAMLYGKIYYRARRKDCEKLWDWRRAAYAPAITRIAEAL